MVLVAALTGLRWGEQVALRIEEEVDLLHNKIRITRSFYRRVAQTPKSVQSIRDVDMCPTVQRVMQAVPWKEGLVFSPDGAARIGDGSWLKRQWRGAQIRAGIRRPIRWHGLRHQFVSLLIAAGKSPKYIALQAGHASAGFTLDRYGHLFETVRPMAVEWWDDLFWPDGYRIGGEIEAGTNGVAAAEAPNAPGGV
jgi:integrase